MNDINLSRCELGRSGLEVSVLGFGCLSLAGFYGDRVDVAGGEQTIREAFELGVNLFDTSDVYGTAGSNEELLGRAVKGIRDQVIVATKFGNLLDDNDNIVGWDGSPPYVRQACEASLRRLDVDVIDLYQLHRIDPKTPIEETVGAMSTLVDEGKVRYLGLSEARPEDIRRASAVAPIATLQSEYSMFERGVEVDVLPLCEELGIGFLAYAPLGRGLLAGSLRSQDQLDDKDPRRTLYPWLTGEHLDRNVVLAQRIQTIADAHGATSAQVALAWLLQRPQNVVPIPGTRRSSHLRDNVASAQLVLDSDELVRIDDLVAPGQGADGERVIAELAPTRVTPERDGASVREGP